MSRRVRSIGAFTVGVILGSSAALTERSVEAQASGVVSVSAISAQELFVVQSGRVSHCQRTSGTSWSCREQQLGR
jgi:hypothetical protein